MQGLAPGHPEPLALADREVLDAVVVTHHRAVDQNDLTLAGRQVGIEKGLHRAVVVGQAEILTFGLAGGAQAEGLSLEAGVGLGEFTEGKHQPGEHLLGKIVEEIALVLVAIKTPQQLVAACRHDWVGQTDPGVVTGGEAADTEFSLGPLQHRRELHLPIAAGAGQWGDPAPVALHQKVDDLLLKALAAVDHMVRHPELLTDAGRIHQALSAAGPLAAHQPEGETLHLPTGRHQQRGGQGAVHPSGKPHGQPMLSGPGAQALECLCPGGGDGAACSNERRMGATGGTWAGSRGGGGQNLNPPERGRSTTGRTSHHGARAPAAGAPISSPWSPLSSSPSIAWPRRDAAHLLVSSEQMAQLEQQLFDSGLPVEALMEKAALAISARLLREPEALRQGVLLLVGPGHNGGDALVVARELHLAGVRVRLWSPFERHKPLTDSHWRHARWLGIERLSSSPDPAENTLWIDGLFGIGQRRSPGEEIETLLGDRARLRPDQLVAIDTPTGLCADSGRLLGSWAARARRTYCLGLIKQGLVQDRALAWVGQLVRLDLGLPAALLEQLPPTQPLGLSGLDQSSAPSPQPAPEADKYGRGRLLVVSGSAAYPGAALLSLLGASASGCGSLRAAVPEPVAQQLWSLLPHVVLGPDPGEPGALARFDAVLIGPGLVPAGSAERPAATQPFWEALQAFAGLVVIDADGLNRLAAGEAGEAMAWLQARQGATWLTPHGGEFVRLFPDLAGEPPWRPPPPPPRAAVRPWCSRAPAA